MTPQLPSFLFSENREPHHDRTLAILKEHPEIRKLMGHNPFTFLFVLGMFLFQIGLALLLRNQSWWLILLVAYFIGAFASHALLTLMHECNHGLVFRRRYWNELAGIFSNIPNIVPDSVSFKRYHLKHHSFQGIHDLDADMPSEWEAKFIGNSKIGKAFWLLFQAVFLALRPIRLKEIKFTCRWTILNIIVVLVFDIALIYFFGNKAFFYLLLSCVFAVGLHPLGARWIQEHYIINPPQETYSYYGPINLVSFNLGYHNEHHDFTSIPWNRLPEVRKIAPEWYDSLVAHNSLTKLLFRFLLDPSLTLYSRMARIDKGAVSRRL